MKELKIISACLVISILLGSCYYDVEEELYPTLECATDNISYTSDIFPILETDCYECHSAAANFGNITLEGYNELLKYVNNGSLIGAINHSGGYSPMPKGRAKLLDCEIEKFKAWIEDGAQEN